MAMESFKAQPLPHLAPSEVVPRVIQDHTHQLLRVLGLYFRQLDSLTPNQAESYRADIFYLKSPDTTYWKLTIDDNGVLTYAPQRTYNLAFSVGFTTGFQ